MLCFDVLTFRFENTERYRQGRNMNEDPKDSGDGQRAAVLRQGAGSSRPKSKDGVLIGDWGVRGAKCEKSRGRNMQATTEMLEAGRKQLKGDTWDRQLAELRQLWGQE